MAKTKTIAMVPARIGSERLKEKNLALVGGEPMIAYAIAAAMDSGAFERVIVNADSERFRGIAAAKGAEFYLRPERLGSSTTKADEVVYDFIEHFDAPFVAWVNPTSPLQDAQELRAATEYFFAEQLDTLITVKNEQVHSSFAGKPINFSMDEPFSKTQDLVPVQLYVYSLMMWNAERFRASVEAKGHGFFCGKVGLYPVNKFTSLIVKTEEDLRLVDFIMRARQGERRGVTYFGD